MKTVIYFICDICGNADPDAESIAECEKDCYLKKKLKEKRFEKAKKFGQLTLGELIDKCEKLQQFAEYPVIIDIDSAYYPSMPSVADYLSSYRGYYEDLSIIPREGKTLSCKDFLKILKDAVGREFSGWRGGNYLMQKETLLWVSEPGESAGLAVTDLISDSERHKIYLVANFNPH